MSRSVWYKKRDDLLYLLDKRNDGESFTDREDDRFEKYLDKTSLVTYHTHDKDTTIHVKKNDSVGLMT